MARDTTADPEGDLSDPYLRSSQTFARLTPDMIARVAALATEEEVPRGARLFRQGERGVDFFVVLAGQIEVYQVDPSGAEAVITVHEPREFTGEVHLLGDEKLLVTGRAKVDSRVLRVKHGDLRRLLMAEPDIGEIVTRAFILRRVGLIRHAQAGVVVIGSRASADLLRIERFLTQNGHPHRLVDVDVDPDARGYRRCLELRGAQLPAVIHLDGLLCNPDSATLADALGIAHAIDAARVHDVAVVGAGPAGLAAAVYAASEGLDVIVIEGHAPGGQAGTSSKIENYLGFPTGISGQALAGRAQIQARKFGAKLAIARHVVGLECAGPHFRLQLEGGAWVSARSVVIASGARYRGLALPDYARYEGQGIHYAATAMEEQLCVDCPVVIVGGGNSAGQAAMYLARRAAHVHILVRGAGLAATMSDYLVQRIAASPRISLHTHCEVTELAGDSALRRVTWCDRRTGASATREVSGLFVMIGAEPNTAWLGGCVELDAHGFVVTGQHGLVGPGASVYRTSRPGVYAVGDVRAGSVKRVASAVGEGSVVVQALHGFLHPPA